jgi:hypothetical protein
MGNLRGLRTRLCPKCQNITPHRTLYARATSNGKRRWSQLFWACTKCGSLNHIVLPAYRLERASAPLPSALAVAVVNALGEGPLDIDELIMNLRQKRVAEVSHVFNSEVGLAVDFLKGRGVVAEEVRDCTERVLDGIRVQTAESSHLGICPAEQNLGPQRSLISLYAQKQSRAARGMRLVSAGVFCLRCQYHRVDM